MINFKQYYHEGVGSFIKKMSGDVLRKAVNPAAILRGAGGALQSASKVAGSVSKFMKQGPSLAGTGAALTAAGNIAGKAGAYVKAGFTNQDINSKPAGSTNLDIKTYQDLVNAKKINLNLPKGKMSISQLARGDVYSVVDSKTGQATQYKVTNKQGNIIQVVDAAQKKI